MSTRSYLLLALVTGYLLQFPILSKTNDGNVAVIGFCFGLFVFMFLLLFDKNASPHQKISDLATFLSVFLLGLFIGIVGEIESVPYILRQAGFAGLGFCLASILGYIIGVLVDRRSRQPH